jgi:tetratricopeptide (TPR) repeat protein
MKIISILLLVFFLLISCNRAPDEETIRLYVRASDAYTLGRFHEVTEILRGQNNFVPALILRAKAEYFLGDLENAEKTCRRAIKLRPSSFEASLYLARILRDKGDYAGAQSQVESLLADNPQDIRTLRLAAELAFNAGRLDETAILLDRAAEFSAESAMVLLDRARLRWVTGASNEAAVRAALEDLSRARAMLPWDTPLERSINNLERTIREAL